MKKLLICCIIFWCLFELIFPCMLFAEEGDIPSDHINTLWKVAAQENVIDNLLTNMNAVPQAYSATHSQNDWVIWLKMEIAVNFGAVFYHQVFEDILAKIVGYNYGNPRIDEQYEPPENVNTSTANTITCDDDPTQADRDVLLYERVSGVFTEKAAGSLNTGTWTFSGIPAGSLYILVYDDDGAAFPTEYLTVTN